MKEAYRIKTLENAREKQSEAREAYNNATSILAKREASEDLEFWGNKVAFLEVVRGEDAEQKSVYSLPITKPENAQAGLQNCVQLIINNLEKGNMREALLQAVSLRGDIADGCYEIAEPTPMTQEESLNGGASLYNKR